jgi:hypothetical protein
LLAGRSRRRPPRRRLPRSKTPPASWPCGAGPYPRWPRRVAGADVDWAAVIGGGERVALPTYAFQRKRHWLDTVPASAVATLGRWPGRRWNRPPSTRPHSGGRRRACSSE